jgi:hypothetical protein
MGAVIETSKTTSLFCPTTSRFGIRKWEPLFGAHIFMSERAVFVTFDQGLQYQKHCL